jgi:hypothetical protein
MPQRLTDSYARKRIEECHCDVDPHCIEDEGGGNCQCNDCELCRDLLEVRGALRGLLAGGGPPDGEQVGLIVRREAVVAAHTALTEGDSGSEVRG